MQRTDPLRSFLIASRRRWILLRTIEHGTQGACLGALAATILALLLLIFRSMSQTIDMPLVFLWLVSIGALSGAVKSWLERPGLLAIATYADRQLHLDELLSTAWAIAHHGQVAMGDGNTAHALILARANAQARTLHPAMLKFHRMTARHWGASCLCLLLCAAIGLLAQLHPSHIPTPDAVAASDAHESSTRHGSTDAQLALTRQAAIAHAPEHEDRDMGASASNQPADMEQADEARAGTAAGADTNPSAVFDGTGGKNATDTQHLASANSTNTSYSAGRDESESGQTVGGMGAASHASARSNEPGASVMADVANTDESNLSSGTDAAGSWRQARARAMEQLKTSDIPAAYRPLVRDYFSSPTP